MTTKGLPESAIGRLTGNEKECLWRCLLPQTAKEMAIDLGISVHAVEKRLKSARAKLGLSSSLEAARRVAKAEGYGRLVPQRADLEGRAAVGEEADAAAGHAKLVTLFPQRHLVLLILGVPIMTSLLVAAAMLLAQRSPNPVVDASTYSIRTPQAADAGTALPKAATRRASAVEVRAFLTSSFAAMDRDRSGFVERAEAPARFGVGQPHLAGEGPGNHPVTWLTGPPAQAMWIAKADANGDGKVSLAEYLDWGAPIFARTGVPAAWRPRP